MKFIMIEDVYTICGALRNSGKSKIEISLTSYDGTIESLTTDADGKKIPYLDIDKAINNNENKNRNYSRALFVTLFKEEKLEKVEFLFRKEPSDKRTVVEVTFTIRCRECGELKNITCNEDLKLFRERKLCCNVKSILGASSFNLKNIPYISFFLNTVLDEDVFIFDFKNNKAVFPSKGASIKCSDIFKTKAIDVFWKRYKISKEFTTFTNKLMSYLPMLDDMLNKNKYYVDSLTVDLGSRIYIRQISLKCNMCQNKLSLKMFTIKEFKNLSLSSCCEGRSKLNSESEFSAITSNIISIDKHSAVCENGHVQIRKDGRDNSKCIICGVVEEFEFFKVLETTGIRYKIVEEYQRRGLRGISTRHKVLKNIDVHLVGDDGELIGKIVFDDSEGDKFVKAETMGIYFKWIKDYDILDNRENCLELFDDIVRKLCKNNNRRIV